MLRDLTGQSVSAIRKITGLTMQALGDTLGVAKNTVYKWESAQSGIEDKYIEKMVEMLGVNPSWFYQPHTEDEIKVLKGRYAAGLPLTNEAAEPKTYDRTLQENLAATQQHILEEMTRLRQTIDRLSDKISQSTSPVSQPSTIIATPSAPVPSANIIPLQRFIPETIAPKVYHQPLGAGYTLVDYHPDDIAGCLRLPATPEVRKVQFIAPISGNSMYPQIHDGALVLIEPAKDFKNGNIVVAYIKRDSGELTIKFAYHIPAKYPGAPVKIELRGFAPDNKTVYEANEVDIQGVVVDWINEKESIKQIYQNLEECNEEGP